MSISNNRHPIDAVKNILALAFPTARRDLLPVSPLCAPLLINKSDHFMFIFAFADSDLLKCYELLYEGFKKHYADQNGQWDELDLAFVLCADSSNNQFDKICSLIETDTYFCRKFVVSLDQPLDQAFARLPFLPLTPVQGQSLRPASAQTFLQQRGVPAELSRYIVRQGRSAERIIENCINQEFGPPFLKGEIGNANLTVASKPTEQVTINDITISNFRAYRHPQTIKFGQDITILYGPNGFGKTSLFDAVDFVATGEIARLKISRPQSLTKIAKHLDSGDEDGSVSLNITINEKNSTIVRSLKEPQSALLNDTPTDRKSILAILTGGKNPTADRIDNFTRLFRASHLFSQEYQELSANFSNNCQLSSDIVSRMLAFEDYVNAVNRANGVAIEVQKTIDAASLEISLIKEQITTERNELNRLGNFSSSFNNIGALDNEITALHDTLVLAGIITATTNFDTTSIRGWRAKLESQHSTVLSTIEQLTLLAKEISGLPQTRLELAALHQRLNDQQQQQESVNSKLTTNEQALIKSQTLLHETQTSRTSLQFQIDQYALIKKIQPEYTSIILTKNNLNDQLAGKQSELAEATKNINIAQSDLTIKRNQQANLIEKIQKQTERLAELKRIFSMFPQLIHYREQLPKIRVQINCLNDDMEKLRTERQKIDSLISTAMANDDILSREIADIDSGKSDIRKLISQIQCHIHTGTCPLCGNDYESKSNLINRIEMHIAADSASEKRAALIEIRDHIKSAKDLLDHNYGKETSLRTSLNSLTSDEAMAEQYIVDITNMLSALGVASNDTKISKIDQLQELIDQSHAEIVAIETQIQETNTAIGSADLLAEHNRVVYLSRKLESDQLLSTISQLESKRCNLMAEAKSSSIQLDQDIEIFTKTESADIERYKKLLIDEKDAEDTCAHLKIEHDALTLEASNIKGLLSSLKQQIIFLQGIESQVMHRIGSLNLPDTTGEESIAAIIDQLSRNKLDILSLQHRASNLEMAMDTATTAAASTTHRQMLTALEKKLADLEEKQQLYAPWGEYFEEVSRLLSRQQDKAIADFTEQYGPRTSIIQRRLRSVYGFSDIDISSHESAINVRVKHRNEELRPTDYFSQSQQQTLLLGLFLAASSSQTWSTFSPIFLDDPVTHFDDLNTYAFLDLIIGLINSSDDRRQFIISTCDERLFQLSRQKLHYLGERAQFYKFKSFSMDGPTIECV